MNESPSDTELARGALPATRPSVIRALPVEYHARSTQRRTLIKVGYSCNDHCVFCHTDDVRHSGDAQTAEILRKIDIAKLMGYDMVVFSGGEATMRRDLFKLTSHVKRRGMLLGFITNGRVMSYTDVVSRLVTHNLRYVHLSIHGAERIHNKLTGDRSFHQSYAGLRNLVGKGLDLTVNCVVTALNLHHLRDLVDLILPFPDVMLKFSACEPKGAALRNAAVVVPKVSEAAAAVHDAIDYGRGRSSVGGPRFAVENFPFCHLGDLRFADDDLLANRLLTMSEVWDYDLVEIDDFNKIKPPACAGCALSADCPGFFVEYVHEYGDAEAQPVLLDTNPTISSPMMLGVPNPAPATGLPRGFRPPEEARVDTHPRYPDAALVTLMTASCDQACFFCEAPAPNQGKFRFSTLPGVLASLRAMRGRCRSLLLTGGEPSAVPWLADVFRAAQQYGFSHIQMQSHCGAAAVPDVAQRWVDSGLSAVDMPLYGSVAAVHEQITRTPLSYQKSMRGLDELRKRGVRVVLHTTLFRSNLADFGAWLSRIAQLAPDAAYVQCLSDLGAPGLNTQTTPEIEDVLAVLRPAFQNALPPFPLLLADIPEWVAPELSPWMSPAFVPSSAANVMVLPYSDWLAAFRGRSQPTPTIAGLDRLHVSV